MTVARLPCGELWVHSPVEFSEPLARALESIGPPAHFVAPSLYHDMYWPEWFARYPQATFYCAPGFKEAHPELPFNWVLSRGTREVWERHIPKLFIGGMPGINEFVFLHRASRTLIVADLVFNLDAAEQHLLGRLFLKLNGIYRRVGCSRIFRRFIKDRSAFRDSIDRVLSWDFDRIVVGHGGIVRCNAQQLLADAMVWAG
jgi:hypothetical protein